MKYLLIATLQFSPGYTFQTVINSALSYADCSFLSGGELPSFLVIDDVMIPVPDARLRCVIDDHG